jgi:hypothetical protein
MNNPPFLRRIFVCLRFCCVRRIASYVTETTKLKTDKKANKMGGLFVSSCLTPTIILNNFYSSKIQHTENLLRHRYQLTEI